MGKASNKAASKPGVDAINDQTLSASNDEPKTLLFTGNTPVHFDHNGNEFSLYPQHAYDNLPEDNSIVKRLLAKQKLVAVN